MTQQEERQKEHCPCGTGMKYAECCARFHGGELPENALQLMRSRFTAYVLGNADYIIKTTHPANPHYVENKAAWKRSLAQLAQETLFHKLEVLDFQEDGPTGMVTFVAYHSRGEEDKTFTEKSYFEKKNGQWLYLRGQFAQGHLPELVSNQPFHLLPLAYYGDAVLREKAQPIAEITDEIKVLVERMIETMHASAGIGLAAPQVHHSIRLFIIQAPVETAEGKFESGEIQVFINPKLSAPSSETCNLEEGCLSIPQLRGTVRRPTEISVEYTNLEDERIYKRVSGWEARVIMHENDHINGVLFIDRLDGKARADMEVRLNQLKERLA
jgi:peptide deformylase